MDYTELLELLEIENGLHDGISIDFAATRRERLVLHG